MTASWGSFRSRAKASSGRHLRTLPFLTDGPKSLEGSHVRHIFQKVLDGVESYYERLGSIKWDTLTLPYSPLGVFSIKTIQNSFHPETKLEVRLKRA